MYCNLELFFDMDIIFYILITASTNFQNRLQKGFWMQYNKHLKDMKKCKINKIYTLRSLIQEERGSNKRVDWNFCPNLKSG